MFLIEYLRNSFLRKKARRIGGIYGYRIDNFQIDQKENIEFANWLNPLINPKEVQQKEIDFFRKYIPKGSFAIDIGANIGDMTVPMAIAANASGLVLAFDPNPVVFEILKINSQLNKSKTNIFPLKLAAVEKESKYYFASSEASMSNGGLIEDLNDNRHGKFKLKEPIQGIKLNDYLREYYNSWLPKLSLIKIDAEGLDYYILKTLLPILEEYRPTVIIEVYENLSDQVRGEIFELLKKFNYEILNIGNFETNINFKPKPVKNENDMPRKGLTENILIVIPDMETQL